MSSLDAFEDHYILPLLLVTQREGYWDRVGIFDLKKFIEQMTQNLMIDYISKFYIATAVSFANIASCYQYGYITPPKVVSASVRTTVPCGDSI